MSNELRVPRVHRRRVDIDRVVQPLSEQRIATGQDHLCIATLQGDADHLKGVGGLHLLGEAINVGVNGGVVLNDLAADPASGAREGAVDLDGEGDHASMALVLGALPGVGIVGNEPGSLTVLKVSRTRGVDDSDVDVGEDAIRREARHRASSGRWWRRDRRARKKPSCQRCA